MKEKKRYSLLTGIMILILGISMMSPLQADCSSKTKYVIQNELNPSNSRKKYPTDKAFANHRYVQAGKIGSRCLYRSCSPYRYKNGRSIYSDKLLKKAGIRTVINLQRPEEGDYSKPDRCPNYYKLYKKGRVKQLSLRLRMNDKTFKKKVAKGLIFMSNKKGPYLVHCALGRDRTGFFCALLECFMGATYDEVVNDYMQTYKNEIVKQDAKTLRRVRQQTIRPILINITESMHPERTNLKKKAEKYMTEIGVTKMQQRKLREHLKEKYK